MIKETAMTDHEEPTTEAGRRLLEREAYNSRSFALITAEAILAIEAEARATAPAGLDVRPELVQWFHDGEEICEHDYSPSPCEISADALLRAFTVEPRIYEHADGTFGFESHHFERLHRAALAADSEPVE